MDSELPPVSASDRDTAWEQALSQSVKRNVVVLPSFAHMLDDTDQR